MHGGRYEGELFVRFDGDKEAGQQFMQEARKVMGETLDAARFNSLNSHKVTKRYENGLVIVAEKIGDLNRVTIAPPPPAGGKKPIRVYEDLVVTAGTNSIVGGERAITPVIGTYENEHWKSFFYRSSAPGYDAAKAAGYAGGTYFDAFPTTFDDLTVLGDSNVNWCNDDGEYCSWLCGMPVAASPYRHPNALYSAAVNRLGRRMFSLTDYVDENGASLPEQFVLAAAFKDDWLYFLASNLGPLNFTPRPASASQMHDAWASPMFATQNFTYVLYRVQLERKTDPLSGQMYFVAIDGTHQVIASASLARAYSRWVFSRDLTQLVTYQLPEQAMMLYKAREVDEPLSGPGLRFVFDITIDEDNASASLSSSSAGEGIFEDSGVMLLLTKNAANSYNWVCGTYVCPAYRFALNTQTTRRLLYADPYNGKFIFSETVAFFDNPASYVTRTNRFIVVEGGVETIAYTYNDGNSIGPPGVDGFFNVRDDFDATDAVGLVAAYRSVCGVTFSAFDPEDGDDEPAAGQFAPIFLIPGDLPNILGLANGGMAFSLNSDEDATSWEWDHEIGFGYGGSFAPIDSVDGNIFLVSFLGTSTPNYVAFSGLWDVNGARVHYIPNGDLMAMIGNAFPGNVVNAMYVLGKPPMEQPLEKAA